MLKYLVFDVDNTLIDFDMSIITAEKAIANNFDIKFSEEYFTRAFEMINTAWMDYKMFQTNDNDTQKDWHHKYREFLLYHYKNMVKEFGINHNPHDMMRMHFKILSETHYTMEKETLDMIIQLSKNYCIVLATNSVNEIRGRFDIFMPYTYKAFVSDEMKAIKPSREFFEKVLKGLECSPDECLMIGDSKTDDVKGAKNSGFYTCWYRRGKDNVQCEYADYSIDSITELPSLLEKIS